MNWLDILFLFLLLGFVIEGVRIGFSRTVIGLISAIAGLFLAAWFYGAVAAYFKPWLASAALANIAAFLLIFIAVQMFGALVGLLCAKIFKWTGLGWLDRLLGAFGGAVKAAFAAAVLVLVFSAFRLKPLEEAIAGSRAAPHLLAAAQVMVYACPRSLRDDFAETYDRIRELWRKRAPATTLPAASA
ncbi:MAG: CvpA family protein [Bryobacteraceae bacterium]